MLYQQSRWTYSRIKILVNPNTLCIFMWEGREGWMKEDRRKNRNHDVLTRFRTRTLTPTGPVDASHWGQAMELQQFRGYMRVHSVTSLSLVSCPLVQMLIGVVFLVCSVRHAWVVVNPDRLILRYMYRYHILSWTQTGVKSMTWLWASITK